MKERRTLYKVINGKYIECYGTRLHAEDFIVKLDSDGESDYIYYYKGESLRFVECIDYIEQDLQKA